MRAPLSATRKDTMPRSTRLAGLVISLCFSLVLSAQADPVTHWNGITLTEVTTGRAGPPGLLDIALVQAAVHDAVQVIEGRYQPYHYSDPSQTRRRFDCCRSRRGSTRCAHSPLSGATRVGRRQPTTIDGQYFAYLSANGLTGNAGLAIGEAAAAALYENHYRPRCSRR